MNAFHTFLGYFTFILYLLTSIDPAHGHYPRVVVIHCFDGVFNQHTFLSHSHVSPLLLPPLLLTRHDLEG